MFLCSFCDYSTSYKSDLNRHFKTRKHKYNASMPEKTYDCVCGRNYIYRASLYNHRKKCETVKLKNSENTTQNAYPKNTVYSASDGNSYTGFNTDTINDDNDGDEEDERDADFTSSPVGDTDEEHIHINISMGVSAVDTSSDFSTSIPAFSTIPSDSSVISGVKMNAAYLEHLNALKREREKIQSVSTDISASSTHIFSSTESSSPPQMMSIISTLMEQNQRLQELIIEQARKSNEREERLLELASRPTTTNINNPRVNILNVLNTEYKEAMDISQFLDSIEVSLEDMFYTRDKGYVQGLCNVFVKQIENMNINERPIHCADRKRLKFFVKADNKWTRDDANKFIYRAMSDISEKHVNTLAEWKRLHPNWMDVEELRDEYIQITRAIIGESTPDKEEKARRAFAKNISASTEFKYPLKG